MARGGEEGEGSPMVPVLDGRAQSSISCKARMFYVDCVPGLQCAPNCWQAGKSTGRAFPGQGNQCCNLKNNVGKRSYTVHQGSPRRFNGRGEISGREGAREESRHQSLGTRVVEENKRKRESVCVGGGGRPPF